MHLVQQLVDVFHGHIGFPGGFKLDHNEVKQEVLELVNHGVLNLELSLLLQPISDSAEVFDEVQVFLGCSKTNFLDI